jgi:hypothetical protein
MGTGAFWSPTRKTGDALLCRDPAASKPALRAKRRAIKQAAGFILGNVEHIFTSCGIVE